jgi:hypothetical protein
MPLDVHGQLIGSLVPAGTVLLKGLHRNPVQIAPEELAKLSRLDMTMLSYIAQGIAKGI